MSVSYVERKWQMEYLGTYALGWVIRNIDFLIYHNQEPITNGDFSFCFLFYYSSVLTDPTMIVA